MSSLVKFLYIWEAIAWCDKRPDKPSLFINRELDGYFHIYDGDSK